MAFKNNLIYRPQGSGTLRQQLTILHILHMLHILHIIHNLHLLHQEFYKKQNIPKMSQEKRQLLIENAFKRIYKRTSLSQEQGIDLCNND